MKQFRLTTITNEDGTRIVHAAGRIADHLDCDEPPEWIDFQIAIDEPTVRNGAILRTKILEQVRDTIDQLITDYGRLVPGNQQDTQDRPD